jgi:hypothetical protein
MYKINKTINNVEKLEQKLFKELYIREREHLQEWIANNPSCLNKEDWTKIFEFMLQHVPKFEAAFKKPIKLLSRK